MSAHFVIGATAVLTLVLSRASAGGDDKVIGFGPASPRKPRDYRATRIVPKGEVRYGELKPYRGTYRTVPRDADRHGSGTVRWRPWRQKSQPVYGGVDASGDGVPVSHRTRFNPVTERWEVAEKESHPGGSANGPVPNGDRDKEKHWYDVFTRPFKK